MNQQNQEGFGPVEGRGGEGGEGGGGGIGGGGKEKEVAAGRRVQLSRCGPSIFICMTLQVNPEEFSCGL